MAIPPKKVMAGLGMEGHGNLMLVDYQVGSTFIRSVITYSYRMFVSFSLLFMFRYAVENHHEVKIIANRATSLTFATVHRDFGLTVIFNHVPMHSNSQILPRINCKRV